MMPLGRRGEGIGSIGELMPSMRCKVRGSGRVGVGVGVGAGAGVEVGVGVGVGVG